MQVISLVLGEVQVAAAGPLLLPFSLVWPLSAPTGGCLYPFYYLPESAGYILYSQHLVFLSHYAFQSILQGAGWDVHLSQSLTWSQSRLQHWHISKHKKLIRSSYLSAKVCIGSAHWTKAETNPSSVQAACWPALQLLRARWNMSRSKKKIWGGKTKEQKLLWANLLVAFCWLWCITTQWARCVCTHSQLSSLFLLHQSLPVGGMHPY